MRSQVTLPKLEYAGYEKAKLTLHLLLQIVGKVRLMLAPRKNHWWYITLYVDPKGLTTGPIPYLNGSENFKIDFDFHRHVLEVFTSRGESREFELKNGLTVAAFYEQLMKSLKELGVEVTILSKPYDLKIDKKFDEIKDIHHYDPDYAQRLWRVLLFTDSVFKEFSGRFYGKTCPVHLYWHSMDLVVTRFSGKTAPPLNADARISDKDAYSHECISFGFWPGDDNMKEPAFYSYTYPSPEGIENQRLAPAAAAWGQSNGSPMALLTYAHLRNSSQPRKDLLDFLETAYHAGASLAGWDIKKLTVPPLEEL